MPLETIALPSHPRRPSSRHWKVLISVAIIMGSGIVGVVFWAMHSSDAEQLGITTAKANPALTAHLGSPITVGWFVTGNIEVTPASGHAELAVPISGPRGKGTLYIEAIKRAGQWQLTILQLADGNGFQRIDLLPTGTSAPPPNK